MYQIMHRLCFYVFYFLHFGGSTEEFSYSHSNKNLVCVCRGGGYNAIPYIFLPLLYNRELEFTCFGSDIIT